MKKYLLGILFALLASSAHAYDWRTAIMAENSASGGGGSTTASIIEQRYVSDGQPTQTANVGDIIVLGVQIGGSSTTHATATLSGAIASGGFVEKAFIGNSSTNNSVTFLTATVTTAGVPFITNSNYWYIWTLRSATTTGLVATTLMSTSANPFITPITTTAKSSIFALSSYVLTTMTYGLTSSYFDGTNS